MLTRKAFLKSILAAAIASGTPLTYSQTASKALVVFYSWSGNTRAMAQAIANELKADLYEIRTVEPYHKFRKASPLMAGI